MKKFSIITPAYMGERWIAETIESVLSQEGDFEIVSAIQRSMLYVGVIMENLVIQYIFRNQHNLDFVYSRPISKVVGGMTSCF